MALTDEDLKQIQQHLADVVERVSTEALKAQREEFDASMAATQARFQKQIEQGERTAGLHARSVVASERSAAAWERIAEVLERVAGGPR